MGKKKSKGPAKKASGNDKNVPVEDKQEEESNNAVEEANVADSAAIPEENQPVAVVGISSEVGDVPGEASVSSAAEESVGSLGPVVSVCYIEVNDSSLDNVGDYVLESNGQNVFNVGIIFAANIGFDATTHKAVLTKNPHVEDCLASGSIQKLQDKGIKVLLSILGDHAGVGVCNFADKAAAEDFAQQVADTVEQYNLDGVDIDDEYADYSPEPNDFSFVYFVQALRSLLPAEKLITFYCYGDAVTRQSYEGVNVGSFLTYSWNARYGTFNAPNVPGLTNKSLSAAAVQVNATSPDVITSLAQSTVDQKYGVFMFYNLLDATGAGDYSTALSAATQVLYGSDVKFIGTVAIHAVDEVVHETASSPVDSEEFVPNDTTLAVAPTAEAAAAPAIEVPKTVSTEAQSPLADETTQTVKPVSAETSPTATTVSANSDDMVNDTSATVTPATKSDAKPASPSAALTAGANNKAAAAVTDKPKDQEQHCMEMPLNCGGCVVC